LAADPGADETVLANIATLLRRSSTWRLHEEVEDRQTVEDVLDSAEDAQTTDDILDDPTA